MPAPITLSSRLDAVNTILRASGEAPVSTLVGATLDVANAGNVLDETIREVQSEGWTFNTEDGVEFSPDSGGLINLPQNVLAVDFDDDAADIKPTMRGLKVYDLKNHTYTFAKKVKGSVIYLLDWDELPEKARRYITIRAARIFHDSFVGDEKSHAFSYDDEIKARIGFVVENSENADANIFDNLGQEAFLFRRPS